MTAVWSDTRVARLLQIRYPVVQGPFGGGLSSVELLTAVSDAGGLGSYGANWMSPAAITELVATARRSTTAAFNVNLWVPLAGEGSSTVAPADLARLEGYYAELQLSTEGVVLPEVPHFEEQLAALVEAAPPVISFVFGVPPTAAIAEARGRGTVTVGTATTVEEAVALEEAGIDVIVASGSDAGGHRGAFLRPVEESLVGTLSLVPQVVDAVRVPVIAAGGIADVRQIRACWALGAEGVQLGTAFLMTDESAAAPVHKRILSSDAAASTVLTDAFTGRLARAVPNRFSRELAQASLPPYPLQSLLTAPLRRVAAAAGEPDLLNLWSGQSARLATRRSASDLMRQLVSGLSDERPAEGR